MLKIATTLYGLLDAGERLRLGLLVLAALAMAAIEIFAIAAVVPFLALAADPAQIAANERIAALHRLSGIAETRDFLMALGVALFAAILLSNGWTAFVLWAQSRFVRGRAHGVASRLMRRYAGQPYVWFLHRNSAELVKNALHEVDMAIDQMLTALLRLITRALVSLAIIGLLVAFDPRLALIVAGVLGLSYGGAIWAMRRRMNRLGAARAAANTQRFRVAGELLGAIKEVKLTGREAVFLGRFEQASDRFTRAKAAFQFLSESPRYLLEAVAFGGVVLIAIYYLAQGESTQRLIPVLGLYAFAGYRLMPSLQQMFQAAMVLNYGAAPVELIAGELAAGTAPAPVAGGGRLPLVRAIDLVGIDFAYPRAGRASLHGLSLTIPAAATLGIVGTTGSGKSTLVDLILGLLRPAAGEIRVDGVALGPANLRAWQNNLGYVPQQIYLADDSIARNIAFGRPDAEIDQARVERAARTAQIHDFIAAELPQGYDTEVGERGVRLSGGQRQRIGIARALYDDPEVLVFDEATSALDPATEAALMEAIKPLAHRKTLIIVSHRRETLDWADRIVELEAGRIGPAASEAPG